MVLKIDRLKKVFAHSTVLHEVSFKANAGEVIVLLGKSGSGKSTLLKCLNLLEIPDGGSFSIGTHHFSFPQSHLTHDKKTQLRQTVGMVFQQFHLWPHKTIEENLIIAPMTVKGMPRSMALQKAHALLEQMHILEKSKVYPGQLSGGQQQRAAIARALMMDPQVLLFDEPTSALDPQMTHQVSKIIKSLAQAGKTLVIATHEIDFAKKVADQIIFLHAGYILESGRPEEMLSAPQTPELKAFLITDTEESV